MKLKYRKRQLRHMASEIEKNKTKSGSEILKTISILDAIYWINSAWAEVADTTIITCFNKSGFTENNLRITEHPNGSSATCDIDDHAYDDDHDNDDDDDDLPLAVLKLSKEIFDCKFKELASLDCNVATCDTAEINWDLPISELLETIDRNESDDNDDDGDDDSDEHKQTDTPVCSKSEIMDCLSKIKHFSVHNRYSDMLNCLMDLDDITSKTLLATAKQSVITDFF